MAPAAPTLVKASATRRGRRDTEAEQLVAQVLGAELGDRLRPIERDDLAEPVTEGPVAERQALARISPGRRAGDVLLSELGQRLAAFERLGVDTTDPRARRWIEDGAMPIRGGMPTGVTGLAFVHNLPPAGTYVESTDTFFRTTERNDIPQQAVAYPGLSGNPVDLRIPNVGVLGTIRAQLNLTLTVGGTGAVTANYAWPWQSGGKRIGLNINGQTSIISCEAMDLRARRQRYYRTPREQVSTVQGNVGVDQQTGNPLPGTIANGTYSVTLIYDLPIPHDDYNLAGVVYAQSDQNALAWRIEPPAQPTTGTGDMFTIAAGGTCTLTGTVFWTATIYDIPYGDTQEGRRVLLPDMSWIHGLLGFNQPFSNTGEVQVALIRTAGQLLCTYIYLDNGGAVQIDPGALVEIRQQYGGNRRPRTFNPPQILLEKNTHDYNGRILSTSVAGSGGYFVLDNEVDNPVRDLVVPKGVTELYVVVNIPTSVTLNANSHAHVVEETMFKGR
jgi:hypothetical protein